MHIDQPTPLDRSIHIGAVSWIEDDHIYAIALDDRRAEPVIAMDGMTIPDAEIVHDETGDPAGIYVAPLIITEIPETKREAVKRTLASMDDYWGDFDDA